MKKGTKIILIIVGVLILIGLAYYFLIYKPSKATERGGSSGSNGSNGNNPSTPKFNAGEKVYLDINAPSPGGGYTTNETVVYSAPKADGPGTAVVGKLHRSWWGNQPIGTVVSQDGDWVKVKVGMVSDFKYYPFTVGQGYASVAPLNIAAGKGSRVVFFDSVYLTNKQY